MPEPTEPLTLDNALDVLRTWSWLYEGLERSEPVDASSTERHIVEGAEKGRLRQCSIGWHEECSDRSGINHEGRCSCPCHQASWEQVACALRWMEECLTHLQGEAP